MKFSIEDFFSKCDQIRKKLRIWSHLLKKFCMENFIFCEVWPIRRYIISVFRRLKNNTQTVIVSNHSYHQDINHLLYWFYFSIRNFLSRH